MYILPDGFPYTVIYIWFHGFCCLFAYFCCCPIVQINHGLLLYIILIAFFLMLRINYNKVVFAVWYYVCKKANYSRNYCPYILPLLLSRILGFLYRIFLSNLMGAKGMGLFQLIFPVLGICHLCKLRWYPNSCFQICCRKQKQQTVNL